MTVKRCSICYWCQEEPKGIHTGCYTNGKWKKWLPKKSVSIPNVCTDFKELDGRL